MIEVTESSVLVEGETFFEADRKIYQDLMTCRPDVTFRRNVFYGTVRVPDRAGNVWFEENYVYLGNRPVP